ASLTERTAQSLVIRDQSTSDTMTDSTRLTAHAATQHGDIDIEFFDSLSQLKWLTNHHARSLATEEIVQLTIIDRDLARTRTQENTCGCGLATASAVILSRRHNELFR